MPWKDQLRPGLRALRWLFWPADQETWANVAWLILWAAMSLAIDRQLWLAVLAAFLLFVPVVFLGKRRPPGDR